MILLLMKTKKINFILKSKMNPKSEYYPTPVTQNISV